MGILLKHKNFNLKTIFLPMNEYDNFESSFPPLNNDSLLDSTVPNENMNGLVNGKEFRR